MIQGFKELASVCQAIAIGRQSVLLRKAGIRETTSESGFGTKSFYLLPTHYHEKDAKGPTADFQISVRVDVLRSGDLLDWSQIEKLLPFTSYNPKTIREHFDSRDQKLLHFALVRPFLLQPIWSLCSSAELRGCRSWFDLPPPPFSIRESAIPETEQTRQTALLLS
jgi:hypothetical protein